MSSEGPGAEYAGYRFGLFEKYQGGEIKIKTPEDVEEALKLCSWILFHIKRGVDTTIRADSENASHLKKGKEITKEEVLKFMQNAKFERLNPQSYFIWVKKDKLLPIVRKWEKEVEKREEELIKEEISFSKFKIIMDAFHRATDELGFDNYCYFARYNESIEIFKKNGLYPTKKYGTIGYTRRFRGFERRREEKPSPSSSSNDSRKLTPEELEIRNHVIKRKHRYRNKTINGKKVWGISYKAIVLVDDIDIDPNTGRRWVIGKKDFHNFFKKINNSTSDDGIELAKKLIELYGE